jgi:hypothetical protein
MTGTFTVEWLPDNILLAKRTGVLSASTIVQYVSAVEEAAKAAPRQRWGVLIDLSGGAPHLEDDTKTRDIAAALLERGTSQIAVVTLNAIIGLHYRRMAAQLQWPDSCVLTFFTDTAAAISVLKTALAPTTPARGAVLAGRTGRSR